MFWAGFFAGLAVPVAISIITILIAIWRNE